MRTSSSHFQYGAALIATALAGACVPDEVGGPSSQVHVSPSVYSVSTLPAGAVFEDPPMLELASLDSQFAGFYFSSTGSIEILMTGSASLSRVEPRVRALVGGAHHTTTPVVRRSATYPFIALARYRTVLRQQIFEIPGVVSLGVRESANRVKVGVEDQRAEANVRLLMANLACPPKP